VAATDCGPDAYDGAYDDLINRARAPEPDDEEIGALKAELQQALADPSQLPGDELPHAVEYGDGTDEAFLRRLCTTCTASSRTQRRAMIAPWMRATTKTWPAAVRPAHRAR
jgi:hypothetical protein